MRTLVLALVLLLGGDEFAEGLRAYREGRFADALRAFAAAEVAAGQNATAELLYDKALAALGAGELVEAEIAAEKAAARGGAEFSALTEFLLGNVAFARAAKAEELASRPEEGPVALDAAMAHATAARDLWERAAASRADWPEARRNVERALVKLEELQKKRKAAEKNRKSESRPKPLPPDLRPPQPPDPRKPGTGARPDRSVTPQLVELSPEQVQRLLDKLGEKEKEKSVLRRAQQQARRTAVERDW